MVELMGIGTFPCIANGFWKHHSVDRLRPRCLSAASNASNEMSKRCSVTPGANAPGTVLSVPSDSRLEEFSGALWFDWLPCSTENVALPPDPSRQFVVRLEIGVARTEQPQARPTTSTPMRRCGDRAGSAAD